MNRLLQRCWHGAVRRLGQSGLLALALLIPSLAITGWLPQLSRHADELRAALAAKTEALARPGEPVRRPMTHGEQVNEFMARFPPLAQSSSDLEQVFALAKRRDVALLKGEYQLKTEPNLSMVSYSATFPVRNGYGALKAFAADVLEALPHVSMDELRMSRTDAVSNALDSVVRFTFVYRTP